ncbi:MAG TPA: protein kinase, partial [Gemmatimonadales bacterium]|nr:protein kinase [Gemmatimonadales bacterium]
MSIAIGSRLGPYEIVGSLGAGGMGEVYRARDTRLHREVAIKVLPDLFAADPERLGRFEREAKTLAALNHTHIAQIYGFEQSGDTSALVMELVEGEDLAQRIARGAIPLDEALAIARQIADALEAAHELGIIHRDLKPANIKVRPDGTVKVLDFGLAKAAVPDVAVANSPTFTAAATQMGMIIGTAAYMAPEQARGKAIDKRADIWAFGCVLYEMLTGHQAFAADTVTDIVAAVVKSDPDWTVLPADTPPRLRELLRRCLDKEPRKRLRDIGDARLELDAISAVGHVTDPILRPGARLPPSSSWSPRVPWIAAAAAAIAALAVAAVHLSEKPADSEAINLALLPPAGAVFHEIELSPDGRKIAFTAQDGTGRTQLWIRSLDSPTPRALNATQGASYPFWSPDSRSVAFFAQGKLKKVPDSGGPPQVLAEAPVGRGGTWNRDGVIVFAPRLDDVLYRVADVGGEAIPVTRLDPALGHYSHRLQRFLPDGRRFLYLAQSAQREHLGVYV